MADKWSLVIEAYKKAKKYLWDGKPGSAYSVNRENGRLCLYKAYHDALNEEIKDHLGHARILYMMYEQNRNRYDEGALFHFFLNKAYHEIMIASAENDEPGYLEKEQIISAYKRSKQYIEIHSCRKPHRELREIIGGKIIPDEFEFCGSRILFFRHDTCNAVMKLADTDSVLTLRFIDIYEITSNLSPSITWVSDIICYRHYDSQAIIFDIGAYKIICGEIEAEALE